MQSFVCGHGHSSSCPEDRLAQVRLGGERWGHWQTVTVWACDAQGWRSSSWRSVWNRRGYETRIVRVGAEA